MLLRAALVLAVAALSGCTPSAQSHVARAADRWQQATGIIEPPPLPTVREAWGPFWCGKLPDNVTGCYAHPPEDVITLDMRRHDRDIERTATHEWGHRLGLPHFGRGIMGPQQTYATSYCITREDLEVLCLVYDCKWQLPECGL
jgi:hypothetical protein